MFSLSHSISVLFVSAMLVSVMSACLLEVASVVDAYSAILLAFLDWGDTYCNLSSDYATEPCI